MKMNGITVESRGRENITDGRFWFKKTVYELQDDKQANGHKMRYFFKEGGEWIEVYHKSDYFATYETPSINAMFGYNTAQKIVFTLRIGKEWAQGHVNDFDDVFRLLYEDGVATAYASKAFHGYGKKTRDAANESFQDVARVSVEKGVLEIALSFIQFWDEDGDGNALEFSGFHKEQTTNFTDNQKNQIAEFCGY